MQTLQYFGGKQTFHVVRILAQSDEKVGRYVAPEIFRRAMSVEQLSAKTLFSGVFYGNSIDDCHLYLIAPSGTFLFSLTALVPHTHRVGCSRQRPLFLSVLASSLFTSFDMCTGKYWDGLLRPWSSLLC